MGSIVSLIIVMALVCSVAGPSKYPTFQNPYYNMTNLDNAITPLDRHSMCDAHINEQTNIIQAASMLAISMLDNPDLIRRSLDLFGLEMVKNTFQHGEFKETQFQVKSDNQQIPSIGTVYGGIRTALDRSIYIDFIIQVMVPSIFNVLIPFYEFIADFFCGSFFVSAQREVERMFLIDLMQYMHLPNLNYDILKHSDANNPDLTTSFLIGHDLGAIRAKIAGIYYHLPAIAFESFPIDGTAYGDIYEKKIEEYESNGLLYSRLVNVFSNGYLLYEDPLASTQHAIPYAKLFPNGFVTACSVIVQCGTTEQRLWCKNAIGRKQYGEILESWQIVNQQFKL